MNFYRLDYFEKIYYTGKNAFTYFVMLIDWRLFSLINFMVCFILNQVNIVNRDKSLSINDKKSFRLAFSASRLFFVTYFIKTYL